MVTQSPFHFVDRGHKLVTRTLVRGAVPTLYMRGEDTDDLHPDTSRPYRSIVRSDDITDETKRPTFFYSDFNELKLEGFG